MRKFLIGDIRGDLDLLKRMIDKLGPSNADTIVFLGSYLGPGGNSKAVVDYLLELVDKDLDVNFLKGCYEYMFQKALGTTWSFEKSQEGPLDWRTLDLWRKMGGQKVFESYASTSKPLYVLQTGDNGKATPTKYEIPLTIPERHVRFFENLHQWFEDDVYPIVATHNGGHPVLYGGAMSSEEQVVFGERDWEKQDWRQIPDKTVVFSHLPGKKVYRAKGKIGIDLGAGFGGKLAAYEMSSQDITIVG